ncbi:MAG: 30S ribosomal protein S17 [Candidatus Yanofskybacteria bacterium RIFCSPHIGHO2_01_FULL_45_42]|uniref:Small ribosomal subunit protein uS17 n=3 Tax=Candidatus Yanofskyibacteriota TaxID=1752733 RepID=A0A1F8F5D8_9BACT|nr:MAG: 30S ribosomal protein S17 [Candidatus Yanofskybacteria bacterium RIFCSPHIGHO2_01_FULL_45_42]OGN16339.1 MAG: 30S ribosomal protein S17 [Candidatus Yanofskybacteria bacterium RIFCSPHIGHO2_02_FULL_46_19]OGN27002.1 MAG: 30S ribosomal protein S17 [Candidatus Yanofskybacteria bacterium RIFCSPLOWO2_01_FULL_45_72]OGN32410.1 MAG: 30S ribosomal protein S17 [Candidatus Yanofskybacteria bacterium RIFCSPLOWO2_02_FULL_45_18]
MITEHKKEKNGRILDGVVVSDKMTKTVVVEILHLKQHPKYKKYFKVTRRYKTHDPESRYHVGDKVIIQETRPISKDKRWIVVSKAD